MKINERLKAARIAIKLSQAEVAKALNMPQSSISKQEIGMFNPKYEYLEWLFKAGVSPAFLLGDETATILI